MESSFVAFEEVLYEYLDCQLDRNRYDGGSVYYLNKGFRKQMLDRLTEVRDYQNSPKVFDLVSLLKITDFFDDVDQVYFSMIQQESAANFAQDTEQWFRESYKFMFEPVAMLDMIRFYGCGQSNFEKEVIFRTLISKLIKTRETIRILCVNEAFLDRHLERNPELRDELISTIKQSHPNQSLPDGRKAIEQSLLILVNEIGLNFLNLFKRLSIPLNKQAQLAQKERRHYEALILMMRHNSDDLFDHLDDKQYSVLTDCLKEILAKILFHPFVGVFQRLKREYMTEWVIFTLRALDREAGQTELQSGKANIYKNYDKVYCDDEFIESLSDPRRMFDNKSIDFEWEMLQNLSEEQFYELQLKLYSMYQKREFTVEPFPIPPSTLAPCGNIRFDKLNMMSWLNKTLASLSDKQDPLSQKKAACFGKMLISMKRANQLFTSAMLKLEYRLKSQNDSIFVELPGADLPLPRLMLRPSGQKLEVCYPMPQAQLTSNTSTTNQNLSFNNNDTTASFHPVEQIFIINFLNHDKSPNRPLNSSYLKFHQFVGLVLHVYRNQSKTLNKRLTHQGRQLKTQEELIYFRIEENIVLALGLTNLGRSKNIGSLPDHKTAYFRLFVAGSLEKELQQVWSLQVAKIFPGGVDGADEWHFTEVSIPDHYMSNRRYQVLLIEALLDVMETLPNEVYINVSDLNKGLYGVLQKKAEQLMELGLDFNKITHEFDDDEDQITN